MEKDNYTNYSNQNPVLGSQNQDFYQKSDWLTSTEKVFTEPADVESVPYLYYKPIYGTEIIELQNQVTELRERVKKLEEQLEKKPYILAVQDLNSNKLELEIPLVVTVEPTDRGGFVFWSEDLNTWGEGQSEEEAKDDFLKNIEELYFDLKKDKGKLGPALEKVWQYMQKIIKEI